MSRIDNKTESGFLVYEGFMPGAIGVCHLRIIPGTRRTVFLASELSNNPGPSVTNAIKGIWWQIQSEFLVQAKDNPFIIEHYNDQAIYGLVGGSNRYAEALITQKGVQWYPRTADEIVDLAGVSKKDLIVKTSTLVVNTRALEQEARNEKPHLYLV
jgi:hypothetical protein